MINFTLFDAKVKHYYNIVDFIASSEFSCKPFNNIGLYAGKQFFLHDIKYKKQIFFIIVDGVEYAIRGDDTKYINIENVPKNARQ